MPQTNSSLNKCVAITMEKVFGLNESVIYLYNDVIRSPIISEENPRILFNVRSPIQVPPTYKNYSQNYVIQTDGWKNLVEALYALAVSNLWNSKLSRGGKFILITQKLDLEEKVKLFWDNGMINLIVLAYDSKKSVVVFTSDPQASANNCGSSLKNFLTFDDCFKLENIRLPQIFRKYHNCKLNYITSVKDDTYTSKIRMFEAIRLFSETFIKHLNVTIDILKPSHSLKLNMFSFYVEYRLASRLYTSTFFSDDMIWIVPFPKKVPTMKILKMVFKNMVWFYVLFAFFCTSLTWWLIAKFLNTFSSLDEAFLKVFSITLFGWASKLSTFWSMRCLFLGYVVYSIHIQTAFTSRLIEILTIPQYGPRIKTLNELADSNLSILANKDTYNYFFDHEEPDNALYNKIKHKLELKYSDSYGNILTDFNTYSNSAVLITSNELEILTNVFQVEFCTIENSTLISNLERVFVGIDGAYVFKTIDKIIAIFKESGILSHSMKNVKYDENPFKTKIRYQEKPVLSLQHMYFVFVFWCADKCIVNTIKRVFGRNESVIYLYDNNIRFPIIEQNPRILFNIKSPIQVPPTYNDYSQNYVIKADKFEDLLYAVYALVASNLWNTKLSVGGKFLLITTRPHLNEKVSFFWSHGMINLIVLAYDFDGVAIVFTSDPQAPVNKCGLAFMNLLTGDGCFGRETIKLPKVLRKYHNCEFTYLTSNSMITEKNKVKLFGAIRFFLGSLANHLNASVRILNPSDSDILNFFSFYVEYRTQLLPSHTYTSTFFSDNMVWIVPFPQRIPTMQILKIVFKKIVWIYVLFAFFSTSLTWWLITKLLEPSSSLAKAFLKVFSTTLFGWTGKVDLFWSIRCLFLAYVIYSIHIQTAFTSRLIEILTIPQYEPRIKTLNELANSNFSIFTNKYTYDYFFDHEEPDNVLFNKLKNKFEFGINESFSTIVTDINFYSNSAFLVTSNELEILTKIFQVDLYTIDNITMISKIERVFVVMKGGYMLKTIEKLISIFAESGILRHFLSSVEYDENPVRTKIEYEETPVLTLAHLYFVFVFWCAGLCLSLSVLIFESLYVHKLRLYFKNL
ncbi:hypothetical protein FQR65_LT12230 [Abscondita terminalis]|nr:hypothetical protein FQR65_LT12230 [Abscondita terminalis]